jgi:hypothetical protein
MKQRKMKEGKEEGMEEKKKAGLRQRHRKE